MRSFESFDYPGNLAENAKIAINKSVCKEYDTKYSKRTVYLNDNDEFQITLFNPKNYTIGIKVYINGDYLGNILVIKPGQRVWLERHLDCAKKFKFSTYEVDDCKEVKSAIKNNGEIKIKFFREVKKLDTPKFDKYWDNNIYYDNNIDLSKCNKLTSFISDTTCNLLSNSCDINVNSFNTLKSTNDSTFETGRIEKGSYSNQKFKDVDIEFEYYPCETTEMKLIPMSQKPVFANDLQKIYCTECGRKLKQKFKFCPYCGNKIDID